MEPNLKFRLLLILYVILVLCALAYPLLARRWAKTHGRGAEPPQEAGIGTVNGEPVTVSEFYAGLRAQYGARMFNQLALIREISQEAQKSHLTLTAEEMAVPMQKIDRIKDPAERNFLENDLRSRLLLRKLILKDVTESRRHEVYDAYRRQLIQYGLSDILVSSRKAAGDILARLKKGSTFEELARQYSEDARTKTNGGRMGVFDRPALQRVMDPRTLLAVTHGHAGDVIPMPMASKVYLLKLDRIWSSYNDLQPAVEDIFVEAGRVALMRQLAMAAKVDSPYLHAATPPVSEETVAPLPGNAAVQHTAAPLPGNSKVHESIAPLQGNPVVHSSIAPLPGNPAVHKTLRPLPGNAAVKDSPAPGKP
jgi:hypothetical protein